MFYQAVEYNKYTPTLAEVENMGIPIFNDWWNTYIPEYKEVLIAKILRHYHFNQIGAETPERFVYYLNTQLAEIMPYYNQLYASELINFNPLLNHSIQANGRTIENILAKANTTNDKFAKAIRDFVGKANKAGNTQSKDNVVSTGDKDYTETTDYNKNGSQHDDIHENTKGNEQENTGLTGKLTTTIDGTVNETGSSNTSTTDDKTVTETPADVTTKEMKWGATVNTEINKDEKTTSSTDGTKNWTETTDDDSTTKTVTDLDETTVTDREQDYADTPQKELDTGKLRKDYLTNVTWTDENSKHNADTTSDVTFADDMTKTHDEETSEKGSGTKVNTDTENVSKGGVDTETSTRSGEIKTVTDDDGTSNTNTTNNTTKHQTEVTDKTEDTDRTLETSDDTWTTKDKEWAENGYSTTSGNVNTKDTSDRVSTSNSINTEENREVSDMSQSSVDKQEKESEETTDTGSSNTTQGFMNISPSALLEAFRKTFLNIDMMIIEELRDNFMLVY